MRFFLVTIITVIVSLTSYSAHAAVVNGNACESCSLSEAQQIAIQVATPVIQCQPPNGETGITIGNQECYSQPKKYYVYSKTNDNLYGFSLYHFNQGANSPFNLQLKVDVFTPSTTIRNAVVTSIAWHNEMKVGLEHLSNAFTKAVNSPSENLLKQSSMSYTRSATSGSSCSSHPSYRALYDALSPGFKADLQLQMNQELNTLNLRHYGHFERVRLTGAGVQASLGGVGVNFSIDYADKNDYAQFTYAWLTPALVGTDYEAPRIVFTLGVDEHGVFATLNERMSVVEETIIENLRDPLASGDLSNVLPYCAAEALRVFFDSTMESTPIGGGGSGSEQLPPGGDPGGLPEPGVGGGAGGGDAKCKEHYYIEGQRVMTIITDCAT